MYGSLGWDVILNALPLIVTLVRMTVFRPGFVAISLRTRELSTAMLPKVRGLGEHMIEGDV
jgi:hypothetical protein